MLLLTLRKLYFSSPNGDQNFVENKALLDYSKLGEGVTVKPTSLAVSEYHFLLLVGNKVKVRQIFLKIINRIQKNRAIKVLEANNYP